MGQKIDGWRCFVCAFGVFLAQFFTGGVLNSYPLLADLMESDSKLGKPSKAAVSLGSSVAVFAAQVIGVGAAYLSDRFSPRPILIVSALILCAGLVTSSLVANGIACLLFTFSVPMAVALGSVSSPGPAAVSTWSEKYRGVALGIVFSGSGAGSSLIPLAISKVRDEYDSWRTSFLFMGIFGVLGVLGGLMVTKRRPPELLSPGTSLLVEQEPPVEDQVTFTSVRHLQSSYDPASPIQGVSQPESVNFEDKTQNGLSTIKYLKAAATHKTFWIINLSSLLYAFGYAATSYIIIPMSKDFGVEGSPYARCPSVSISEAAALMTAFGTVQILFSLVNGRVADRINNGFVFGLSCGVAGIVAVFWGLACAYYQLVLIAVVLGACFAGCLVSFAGMVTENYMGDHLGTMIAVCYLFYGVGAGIGPPLVMLIDDHELRTCVLGVIVALGGAASLFLRPVKRKLSVEID